MSFICEKCGDKVGPGISPKKKVIQTKKVTHIDIYKDEEGRTHKVETPGTQIVKEINICPKCVVMEK
jgi:hypothetical protein